MQTILIPSTYIVALSVCQEQHSKFFCCIAFFHG